MIESLLFKNWVFLRYSESESSIWPNYTRSDYNHEYGISCEEFLKSYEKLAHEDVDKFLSQVIDQNEVVNSYEKYTKELIKSLENELKSLDKTKESVL